MFKTWGPLLFYGTSEFADDVLRSQGLHPKFTVASFVSKSSGGGGGDDDFMQGKLGSRVLSLSPKAPLSLSLLRCPSEIRKRGR